MFGLNFTLAIRSSHYFSLIMINKNRKYWDLIVLLSGVLLALSFSPYDFQYFAVIAVALLFMSWQGISPSRAALRGFLFGLGLYGVGVYWVFISVHDFGGAGIVSSIMLTLLFVGFWSVFSALTGYISVKFTDKHSALLRLICFSVIWVLMEYLRGEWIFNGFPWFQLAYSQLDSPLAVYIPIVGVYGVSWLVALTASLLAMLIEKGKPDLLVFLIIGVWLTGWLMQDINWTRPIGQPFKVTLIQGNISQDKKWQPAYREEIMRRYKRMTRRYWDSQVIIWPESAVPAYYHQVKENYLLPLAKEAKKNGTELIVSLPLKNDRGQKFNGVMTLGRKQGVYRKIHLLPFGEYLPIQPLSGWILDSLAILPVGIFTAGSSDQPLLHAAGYPFIVSICYEDAFGEEGVRRLSEAAYLVNVTNDGWFGDSTEPYQHMQIARMRALETGRYLLRATNTGLTAVVAPNGKITRQAPPFTTTALTSEITPMGGMTAYAEYGDKPVLFLLSLILLGALLDKNGYKNSGKRFLFLQ